MIATVSGIVGIKKPTAVTINVGGIGLEVHIPLSTYEKVPAEGEPVQLFTHLHVREDILKLYGFKTEAELDLFRMVISVSGIGPNLGLSILSGASVQEFKKAVLTENTAAIKAIPGIGLKTAQRTIVELKEKIGAVQTGELPIGDASTGPEDDLTKDAVAALTSLGLKPQSARAAVDKARKKTGDTVSVQELIRKALSVS